MSFAAEALGTPLVRLARYGPQGRLFAKVESMLPTGSAYDRIAGAMIAATKDERIVVEGSGSVALAFASAAAVQRRKLVTILSNATLPEHLELLRRFDVQIEIVEEETIEAAVAAAEGTVVFSRHHTTEAAAAFASSLGRELGEMLDPDERTVLVAPLYSGALLVGTAEGMRSLGHEVDTVGTVRPLCDSFQYGVRADGDPLPGVDRTIVVDDRDAHAARMELARAEGILVGMGSAAAVRVAREEANGAERVVTILVDAGDRYFSVDRKFGG